jgi:hypothetical protein
MENEKEEMCSPSVATALVRASLRRVDGSCATLPQEKHSYGNLPYNIFY